jgi:hypothetical protein
MNNRHFMGEHNGYFRVAVTYGDWVRNGNWLLPDEFASAVYSFDANLKRISYIDDIAPGEGLDSVSFSGNFGYISTSPMGTWYDPLFTVDFTNPYDISISEGLEQPGVNMYLKNVDGTPFVIGLGIDSDDNGFRTGLKIELYRMQAGQLPVELFKHTFDGPWSQMDALWNPRAILYMYDEDTGRGLFGFSVEVVEPVRTTVTNPWTGHSWESYVWTTTRQGFYMFEFSTEGEGSMKEYGFVSNFDTEQHVFQNDWWNWDFEEYKQARSLYISRAIVNSGYLYTIADGRIAGYCLETMVKIGSF